MTSNIIAPYPTPLAFLRKNPSKPNTTAIRFGRDAIFERNDRFDKTPPPSDTLHLNEGDLYTVQGRVRNKALLPLALEQAQTEYARAPRLEEVHATNKDEAMTEGFAGIKLANALLAEDKHNDAAFKLLKKSLTLLKKAGYNPTPETASRVYIHGLYNRGCYAFNNELYAANVAARGLEDIAAQNEGFEGLTVLSPDEIGPRTELKHRVAEGLPHLEKAIELSKGTPDHGISHAEYLSAKGEMMHALSHISVGSPEEGESVLYDKGSLEAFQKALAVLESIDPEHYTPQHLKLREKLSGTKIPHLCEHGHRSYDSRPLCQQLDTRGKTLDHRMRQSSIHPVPDTLIEANQKEKEKQRQQRIAEAQQRFADLRVSQMQWLKEARDKPASE